MLSFTSNNITPENVSTTSTQYTYLGGREINTNDMSMSEKYDLWKALDDSRKKHEQLVKDETLRQTQRRNKELRGEIVDVKFSGDRTIVFFKDHTKVIVQCQEGDTFDKEKGLAMACMKKLFKNTGVFNDVLRKWCND